MPQKKTVPGPKVTTARVADLIARGWRLKKLGESAYERGRLLAISGLIKPNTTVIAPSENAAVELGTFQKMVIDDQLLDALHELKLYEQVLSWSVDTKKIEAACLLNPDLKKRIRYETGHRVTVKPLTKGDN